MPRPIHHSKPKVTRAGHRNAAFMALVLGDPARVQRDSIKASTRLTDADLAAIDADIAGKRLG